MRNAARRLLGSAAVVLLAATAAVALATSPSSAAQSNPPTNRVYTATTFYIALTTTQRKVIGIRVPAGSYTVTARLNPFNSTGVDQFSCNVLGPDGSLVDDAFVTSDATSGFASSTLTLLGALTTATPGTIAVKCSDGGHNGQMGINTMVVTEVGSVTRQP